MQGNRTPLVSGMEIISITVYNSHDLGKTEIVRSPVSEDLVFMEPSGVLLGTSTFEHWLGARLI